MKDRFITVHAVSINELVYELNKSDYYYYKVIKINKDNTGSCVAVLENTLFNPSTYLMEKDGTAGKYL